MRKTPTLKQFVASLTDEQRIKLAAIINSRLGAQEQPTAKETGHED